MRYVYFKEIDSEEPKEYGLPLGRFWVKRAFTDKGKEVCEIYSYDYGPGGFLVDWKLPKLLKYLNTIEKEP